MAGRPTLWGAGELLRSFFGQSTQPPASFWLAAVCQIPPSPYVGGAELDEPPISAGYARVELPNETSLWVSDSGQLHVVANEADVLFATATADWGRVAFWAICDNDTDGYVYFCGDMEQEQIIYSGDQMAVGAGELVIELGPFFTDQDF